MWGRAIWLVLAAALTAYGDDVQEESQLKIGRSINLFSRYGYLSLTMRVVPRNESDYVFREPTIYVFKDLEKYAVYPERVAKKQRRPLQGDFHLEFCDNVRQLLQAYFRDYSFERLDKPWLAFTGSWKPETIAKNMGINASFVNGDHCYVLVRLSRFRESVQLSRIPNNINLADRIAEEIEKIEIGNVYSVLMFIQKYGSHYIDSYVTGNSIYQVFVFKKSVYQGIMQRIKARGISKMNSVELQQFFGPFTAEHVGTIKVASGNHTVESWCLSKLRVHYYILTYPNLLKVYTEPSLLVSLNNLLKNEAVLKLDMKTLAPAFKDPEKKLWFDEVLDNYLKLWESNFA